MCLKVRIFLSIVLSTVYILLLDSKKLLPMALALKGFCATYGFHNWKTKLELSGQKSAWPMLIEATLSNQKIIERHKIASICLACYFVAIFESPLVQKFKASLRL